MKPIVILLLLFLYAPSMYCQNYEFCVLGKLGNATIKKNNREWSELKTGDQLKKNDIVSLKDNSYLGLVHSSGKTVELRESGEYKISKLSENLHITTTSILPNLIEMFFGKNADFKDILDMKQTKKSYSKGAIERSIEMEQISILSPKKIILINDYVVLVWSKIPKENKYEIKITDRFNKMIFSKAIDDTSITINRKELNIERDQYYFWRVYALVNPEIYSDEGYFLFLSDKKITGIMKNVEQMKKEVGGNETAVSKILLAFYYENNLLINEADKAFREAIEMSPEVIDYKNLYEAFRERVNLRK